MSDLSPDEKRRIFDFIDRQNAQVPAMQTDVRWIKEWIKAQKRTGRYWITTSIALAALAVAIVLPLLLNGGP